MQTTAKRIATCCSFLLDNLLFSNVIRFLDTAIFLLEDFISCWLDWQRDLAAKQSANLSISLHAYGETAGQRLIITYMPLDSTHNRTRCARARMETLQCEQGPARYPGTGQDPHLCVLEY